MSEKIEEACVKKEAQTKCLRDIHMTQIKITHFLQLVISCLVRSILLGKDFFRFNLKQSEIKDVHFRHLFILH